MRKDGLKKEILTKAYNFVDEEMYKKRDGRYHNDPWWYGWALRESFIAGANFILEKVEKEEAESKIKAMRRTK